MCEPWPGNTVRCMSPLSELSDQEFTNLHEKFKGESVPSLQAAKRVKLIDKRKI